MAADTAGSEWERAVPASAVYVDVAGVPTPLDEILEELEGGEVTVAWADVTGGPAGAVAALKAKTQIAALAANSAANAAAAAADPPTKAEFDAVVTLANALKVTVNAIITALKA